mgnify:CR=1 FL=1
MNRDILKMSMTPASGGGDIRLEALNVECVGVVTLSCSSMACSRDALGDRWVQDWSGKLACVFKILSKERVEFDVNARS